MKSTVQSPEVLNRKLHANTWAELSTRQFKIGEVVTLRGYSVNGVGGGRLIAVASAGLTIDTGFISGTATAGVYLRRDNPKKTPYEFGFVDGGVNASTAINACIAAHGDCFLDGGKTYNIQYQIDNPKKLHGLGGVATLNCTSPTGNTRFGSLNAAVYALGAVGSPLDGVDIQNVNVQCNKLIGSSGSTGIKGFLFQRLRNFVQRNCIVVNCASYAFWDYDISGTGTTFCSGARENCRAIDCQVSFEQVNVRGVTLTNCHGYISSAVTVATYTPGVECIFHCYGGDDMRVVYNNCSAIADGYCPAAFLGLLTVKNVTFNDCQLINNFNNGASIQAAVFFDASGSSNFDNIKFNNCILKSAFSTAVTLASGSLSTADNRFKFVDCEIDGFQAGVQFNVSAGKYSFINCSVTGRATGVVTPFAYYNNGTPSDVQIVGGYATATTTGSGVPTVTNLSMASFSGTKMTPAGLQPPRVRQRTVGVATFGGDGSTYANLNVTLPGAVLNWTSGAVNTAKVTASVMIDYSLSGAGTFPAAVAMAKPLVVALPENNIVRFVGDVSLMGKTARYEVTEWE